MKDGFDVVTDVRSLLNVPEITSQITGKVYPFRRPNNSNKIDIVVGVLNCTNQQMQQANVNIRLHVPSISVTGESGTSQLPDGTTFNKLIKIIAPLVDTQWKYDFNTEVDFTDGPLQDTDGSFFYLIRVAYQSFQNNYKNI